MCAGCHGASGEGQTGPTLRGVAAKYSQDQAVAYIKSPLPPMPAFYPSMMSEKQVIDVAEYMRTIK